METNIKSLTPSERAHLETQGYLVLRDFVSAARLSKLRQQVEDIYAEQGEKAGTEYRLEPQTRRLANLVNCGVLFEEIISEPKILACVEAVIQAPFKLSSLNFRSANPQSDWVQPLHCDVGAVPDEKGFWVCNVIWLLDDFTAENGATRFVPGSHRWHQLPQEVLADPSAPHPEEQLLLEKAGTVVVMNTHLWHGATANRTSQERRALHSFYCRSDKPQQQYQKSLLSPAVQARLRPELRQLLALDDPHNDELCARETKMSGFLK